MTTPTATEILHHTTAFLAETLTNSDHRHRLFSFARQKIPSSDSTTLNTLNLTVQTLENAISTVNPSIRSSSLRLAEKILLSSPKSASSSLLLALVSSLSRRHAVAGMHLLDVFISHPSPARTELSPIIFEDLFLLHLLPVIQWFGEQRSRILNSVVPDPTTEDDRSVIWDGLAGQGLLSRMSAEMAVELKKLERDYEDVVDDNCSTYAGYLKEVLEEREGSKSRSIVPPPLILTRICEGGGDRIVEEKGVKIEEDDLKNGRYNPIWVEGAESVEFDNSSSSNARSPPLYPQRVSPYLLSKQPPDTVKTASRSSPVSEIMSTLDDISVSTYSDSEPEIEEKNRKMSLFLPEQSQFQKQKQPVSAESSCSPVPVMGDSDSSSATRKQNPPKDFVCPITSHIFVDPVTLETGQTYERKAIQEWIDRGNSTCPITRQKLQSAQLPRTNYVLKRLIASWQENFPGVVQVRPENSPPKSEFFRSGKLSSSPTSVISQATSDGTVSELRQAVSRLCTSELLNESEMAVLQIERFWKEADVLPEIQTTLSKPAVINGFVEILFNSVNPGVLRATVFLLSELASRENSVMQTLTRVDSDVECVVALFKKGLVEAAVLIYLLRPSWTNLVEMDMVQALVMVIKRKEESPYEMCMKPKTASVLLLGQILRRIDDSYVSRAAQVVLSEKATENFVRSLEADWVEERMAAVAVLLRCMEEDGNCRNTIADKAELAPVLESFVAVNDGERFDIVRFLSELVKLNRRTFNEQLLHIIKDEGAFSTMHTLLIFLQTALQDQCPVIAGLLLQLDLLAEPRKMSMYREEAIDTLVSCLRNSDFPGIQIAAAETILALQGRFSSSGKPLARVFLLKRAGFSKSYRALMRAEQQSHASGESEENLEEEKAADEWEKKMAFVLVNHEFGLLLEALAEGLKSRNTELSAACFVSATWLTHMLTLLPDTGIQGAARVCLLQRFISIFKSAKNMEDKAVAMLALSAFMDDRGIKDLTVHVKDIMKNLRELKKSSALASEMLKMFSEGQDPSADLWSHKELIQVDCSTNGEVLAITCFKDKIFSGHSDGTIKVWSGRGSLLHLIQESREHTKAVTSLTIVQSGEKLYSGSLDRSIRVWSIGGEEIECMQVHDVKDQVHDLVVANSISCFIPQGAGVKVHSWNGGSKLLNPNKHVKCLALVQGKLYCGCNESSIQEIDLASGTMSTIQTGSRKLIGKANPVYALQVHSELLYSASISLDGAAVKIWNTSNYNMVGSLPTSVEVRSMAVSSELIYLGCKQGTVEIWSKEKLSRVGILQTGTNGKVLSMAFDEDGEILVIGTSDGHIQAWGLA